MIVKFDHLTLSSCDVAAHRCVFESLGYRPRFVASDVPNLRIKRRLVSHFAERHDLLFLAAPSGVNLEIINQGDRGRPYSPIVPVFEHVALPFTAIGEPTRLGSWRVQEGRVPDLEPSIYVALGTRTDRPAACSALVMRVPDVDGNVRLWQAFGCTWVATSPSGAELAYTSPLEPQARHLFFAQDTNGSIDRRLDTYGFNYCALVSSSPAIDREALAARGFAVTELERCVINDRVLDVFFVLGEGIVPVEILGPAPVSAGPS